MAQTYRFFKDIQCRYIQFTPIVERITTHSDGRHLACPADSDDLPLAPFSVQPGLNWLCEGYYRFFEHVAPAMDFMKRELLARRSPANIMAALRR